MKKLLFLLLALSLGLLSSCEDDFSDTIQIKDRQDKIRLWPGDTKEYQLIVSSEHKDQPQPAQATGSYSVTSKDPTIAEAKIQGNSLIVTANGIGRTTLVIKDNVHSDLNLFVRTDIYGLYTETRDIKGYSQKIEVVASDERATKQISNELNSVLEQFSKAQYFFESDGTTFTLYMNDDQGTTIDGTYEWDGKRLILRHQRESAVFAFKGADNNGILPYAFQITQDLTDEYQKRYPDAGIEKVSLCKFLAAAPPFFM